jgi:galactose oxidase-like protein
MGVGVAVGLAVALGEALGDAVGGVPVGVGVGVVADGWHAPATMSAKARVALTPTAWRPGQLRFILAGRGTGGVSFRARGLTICCENERSVAHVPACNALNRVRANSPRSSTYETDANQWTERSPRNAASGRRYHALAYDDASDRTILFGGVAGDERADTWASDFSANTWTEMRPAKSPPGRSYHAMAYDPMSDRIVLFGGAAGPQDRETPFADTWTYDHDTNTWAELRPQHAPTARGWHAMADDAPSRTILLFGGGVDRGQFLADTWVFDSARRLWSGVP